MSTIEPMTPAEAESARTFFRASRREWNCTQGRHPELYRGQCVVCGEYDLED